MKPPKISWNVKLFQSSWILGVKNTSTLIGQERFLSTSRVQLSIVYVLRKIFKYLNNGNILKTNSKNNEYKIFTFLTRRTIDHAFCNLKISSKINQRHQSFLLAEFAAKRFYSLWFPSYSGSSFSHTYWHLGDIQTASHRQ